MYQSVSCSMCYTEYKSSFWVFRIRNYIRTCQNRTDGDHTESLYNLIVAVATYKLMVKDLCGIFRKPYMRSFIFSIKLFLYNETVSNDVVGLLRTTGMYKLG